MSLKTVSPGGPPISFVQIVPSPFLSTPGSTLASIAVKLAGHPPECPADAVPPPMRTPTNAKSAAPPKTLPRIRSSPFPDRAAVAERDRCAGRYAGAVAGSRGTADDLRAAGRREQLVYGVVEIGRTERDATVALHDDALRPQHAGARGSDELDAQVGGE